VNAQSDQLILRFFCRDRVGIVAAVSGLIAEMNFSIVESANHTNDETSTFFMRAVLDTTASTGTETAASFSARFERIANAFEMTWQVSSLATPKRVALLVSTEEHCLYDLLSRQSTGELPGEVVVVVSNHRNLESIVVAHGIDFVHVPIPRDDEGKNRSFEQLATVLGDHNVDVVVLARYMQVFPDWLCKQYEGRVINIHHSFLPSFKGARPYHQAHERGVKLIGATCHYVTADLDEGPIIEQDVVRVDHADTVATMRRAGKDVEKAVLARSLRWHLEDRVLLDGHRTVIFQ
jgi:formyltetrahydrofolate deformylase